MAGDWSEAGNRKRARRVACDKRRRVSRAPNKTNADGTKLTVAAERNEQRGIRGWKWARPPAKGVVRLMRDD